MGRSIMDGTPAYEQIDFLTRELEKAEAKIAELEADNELYRKGFQGSCYCCEIVGEKNIEQEKRIAELKEQIENMGHCADCFRPFPACKCE